MYALCTPRKYSTLLTPGEKTVVMQAISIATAMSYIASPSDNNNAVHSPPTHSNGKLLWNTTTQSASHTSFIIWNNPATAACNPLTLWP
jgi:hypothetical protein